MRSKQGLGGFFKQLTQVNGLALVFVVRARFDALRHDVLSVKHEHMGFLVVDPNNGVVSGHGFPFNGGMFIACLTGHAAIMRT